MVIINTKYKEGQHKDNIMLSLLGITVHLSVSLAGYCDLVCIFVWKSIEKWKVLSCKMCLLEYFQYIWEVWSGSDSNLSFLVQLWCLIAATRICLIFCVTKFILLIWFGARLDLRKWVTEPKSSLGKKSDFLKTSLQLCQSDFFFFFFHFQRVVLRACSNRYVSLTLLIFQITRSSTQICSQLANDW